MEALANKIDLLLTASLQLIILSILIKRRLLRRFLWFFIYISYDLVAAALRFTVAGNRRLYFDVYWATSAGGLVFLVLAVRESFLNVFRHHTRFRWFTQTVSLCVGLALFYALLKAWLFPPVNRGWQTAAIIGLEVAEEYSICAVGILYFACKKFFRIRGYEWETGVISGFTIYMALALCGFLTHSTFGSSYRLLSEWLPAAAYLIGEVTWALELSRPETQLPVVPSLTVDHLNILEHYIRLLGHFFRGKS